MAVSERIKAEARRTIDGMQLFYEQYGDGIDDAEEREHRIARVEAALEGCNGLSQEDKIQKTAENLFELTCSQERTYDALRREMKITRDDTKAEIEKLNRQVSGDLSEARKEFKDGLDNILKKISRTSTSSVSSDKMNFFARIVSEHPSLSFSAIVVILLLVFVSGHFDILTKLFHIE